MNLMCASSLFLQGEERKPGDKWMIRGPIEYVPPVEVEVVCKRVAVPLDENEGIYVRDTKSGKVSLFKHILFRYRAHINGLGAA